MGVYEHNDDILLFLFQLTNSQIYITRVYLYLHVLTSLFHPHGVLHLCLAMLQRFLKLKLLKLQFHKIIRLKKITILFGCPLVI